MLWRCRCFGRSGRRHPCGMLAVGGFCCFGWRVVVLACWHSWVGDNKHIRPLGRRVVVDMGCGRPVLPCSSAGGASDTTMVVDPPSSSFHRSCGPKGCTVVVIPKVYP